VNKIFPSAAEALKGVVADGQLLAVGGFGLCGIPEALIEALRDSGVKTSPLFPTMQVLMVLVWASCLKPVKSKK